MAVSKGLSANKQWLNYQIGIYFKNARLAAEVNQDKVAGDLSVTPQFISNWEAGKGGVPMYYYPQLISLYELDPKKVLTDLVNLHDEFLKAIVLGADKTDTIPLKRRAHSSRRLSKPPRFFTKRQIRLLRKKTLKLEIPKFALIFKVPPSEVESWENGSKQPKQEARALMQKLALNPSATF